MNDAAAARHSAGWAGLRDSREGRLIAYAIGVAAAIAIGYGALWWCLNARHSADTLTYWFAAHRVLIGHQLYSMRPDDLWLPTVDPRPHGLYSPPLVVVPWLLLASTPGTEGMVLWWLAMAFCALWAVAALLIGTRGWAGALILPLMPSFTLLIGLGNVDEAMLAGVILVWMLVTTGRGREAGVLLGLMVSVKLTPAVLVVWLAGTRRWRALAWAATTAGALALLVAAVLGPAIFVDYLTVITSVSSTGRTWALAVVILGLAAVMLVGRRHERAAFALAIALIPFGSPAAANHSWAMLAGCAAPWLRPPFFGADRGVDRGAAQAGEYAGVGNDRRSPAAQW